MPTAGSHPVPGPALFSSLFSSHVRKTIEWKESPVPRSSAVRGRSRAAYMASYAATGASELVLPSAGKGEFPRLQDKLALIDKKLSRAAQGVTPDSSDAEALAAHAEASKMLDEVAERAAIFERRAKEPDPDKRIYGPKMAQKVLDFCEALRAAVEYAEELAPALVPLRERLAAAEAASAAAAQAAAAAAALAERDAAAAAALVQAERDEEARVAAEQAAADRAAAIARPLGGGAPAAASVSEMDWLGRRSLEDGLTLGQSLALLQRSCEGSASDLANALQALMLLCTNIVAHPDDPLFRKVRLLNASFQQSVARHPGGVEALLALGFEEVEGLEEEEALFYVLEEPNLEADIERWSNWYDGVKAHQAELQALMDELGVRVLPPAAKGTGWSENAPAPAPARPADNLTLHGQRGGGI